VLECEQLYAAAHCYGGAGCHGCWHSTFFVLNAPMQFLVFRHTLPTLLWSKELTEYAVEMASSGMIYVQSSMKISAGVEGILRLCSVI
jgi:hypothetical protein